MTRVLINLVLTLFISADAISQRVAINEDGIPADVSAALDVRSTTKGLLLPRLTTTQKVLIASPANGLIVYDSLQERISNYVTADGWRNYITTSYWLGFTGTIYNSSHTIGIGTVSPTEKLHLVDGNFKVSSGDLNIIRQSGLIQRINFDYTGSSPNGITQGADFYIGSGARKGYINFTASTTAGADALKFYPSVAGAHLVTITSGGEFRWNGTIDPTIQLQDASVNKGFFQLAGDDFRMGTNSGNSAGKIIIRTSGTDQVFITSSGRVGIGESIPSQELHVAGSLYSSGNIDVTTKVTADNLEFSGKVTKPSVSSSSLTPLCYGSVNADGSLRSVTPNVIISKTNTGFYTLECAGIDENSVIMVTAATERYVGNGYYTVANKAVISIFYDSSTAPPPARDSDFTFVIYKK